MKAIIRLLKPFIFAIFRLFEPLFKVLKVDTKGLYEYAYWRWRKMNEGVLGNNGYEPLYTDLIGLSRDHYDDVKILDIGCGPRGSLEWASNTAERIGLDPLVDRYKNLGIDQHAMTYVDAPAEAIPFDDGYFDIVTSINSLDHVDDLEKTLAEIARVTKTGGEFIVMTHIHEEPTIAEPVEVPWNLTQRLSDHFEVIVEHHYEQPPDKPGAVAAVRAGIPFDHSRLEKRYGVLQARLRRK